MPDIKPPVPHYDRGRIQVIDFLEGSLTPEEYRGHLKACVIKYVSRYRYKGAPLADLLKAEDYLAFLIEFEKKKIVEEVMNR